MNTVKMQYREGFGWGRSYRDDALKQAIHNLGQDVWSRSQTIKTSQLVIIGRVKAHVDETDDGVSVVTLECPYEVINDPIRAYGIYPALSPISFPVSWRERIRILFTGVVEKRP